MSMMLLSGSALAQPWIGFQSQEQLAAYQAKIKHPLVGEMFFIPIHNATDCPYTDCACRNGAKMGKEYKCTKRDGELVFTKVGDNELRFTCLVTFDPSRARSGDIVDD